jgi:putative ABC transport system substrate-binding protein
MERWSRRAAIGGLAGAAAVSWAGGPRAATARIGVTAIVEHPALDACRDGIREELEARGYVLGSRLDFRYQSAQGQPATAAQIARRFVGDGVDVLVPISTPSAQAAVAATRQIPIVFSAVTDPLGAGLVQSLEKPGGNVTGLSDLSPIAQHLDLIREIVPVLGRIGVPYNPGEANAVTLVRLLKAEAAARRIEVVEAAATRSADVQAAARSLAGSVDAIYVPTDNTVVSALEAVIAAGRQARTPVFAGDTDSVARGAIATIGFDYGQIGRQTGALVARVLEGEKPGDIPVAQATGTDLVVNKVAAASFGLIVPEAVLARAARIYD